jgi:uncharacterized protein (DUF58 family)
MASSHERRDEALAEVPEGGARGAVVDPETAARIVALRYEAQRAVDGLRSGGHPSPHRGPSVVFVEHREYRPGDDPRLLDWRAFARSDRHTIKRFEQESQLEAVLLLDASGSMGWGAPRQKLAHAAALLGATALVLQQEGDATSLLRAGARIEGELRARATAAQLERIFAELARPADALARADLDAALSRIAETVRRRGLVVVASDLLSSAGTSDPLAGLDRLVARGHEVWVLHVMHPDELELPYEDPARFVGLEGEEPVEVEPRVLRAAYLAELRAFLSARLERVVAAGARYRLVRTDEPVEHALAAMLARGGGARWA